LPTRKKGSRKRDVRNLFARETHETNPSPLNTSGFPPSSLPLPPRGKRRGKQERRKPVVHRRVEIDSRSYRERRENEGGRVKRLKGS
jgi:hypothetical protein